MEKLIRINRSKITFLICLICMGIIMFVCNCLTNLIADDFVYKFSFATGERITNFFQIPSSIVAHHQIQNGRYIAHFFVHIMLLIPEIIAKLINTFMFILHIYLIYRISQPKNCEHNCLLLVGIFSAVWIFVSRFGQCNLWLTGSINYLWSYTFGLLFILFYLRRILNNTVIKSLIGKILFVLLGFIVGGYSEHASPAFIVMAILSLLCIKFIYKRDIHWHEIAAIITSFLGFIVILLSPANYSNKMTSFSIHTLGTNFAETITQYGKNWQLLVVFAFAFLIALYLKTPNEKRYISAILLIGSLISNYIMTLAAYYPERCASANVVILICAVAVLLSDIHINPYKLLTSCVILGFIIYSFTDIALGIRDILSTHIQVNKNEVILSEAVENGEREATIQDVYVKTVHSPLGGLYYIDPYNENDGLNKDMAKYYGLDKVYAIPYENTFEALQ